MAIIKTSGGQSYDVSEAYEAIRDLVSAGWSGTVQVTDRSTGTKFTIKVPQITSVQP